jgi:hypothetical protein
MQTIYRQTVRTKDIKFLTVFMPHNLFISNILLLSLMSRRILH